MPVNIGDEIIRNVPEQVQKNMDDIAGLTNHVDSFQSQIDNCLKKASIVDNLNSTATNRPLSANMGKTLKDMLNQAIAGVFKYKGSVATYSDLPTSDNVLGDTWNVIDTGVNYCWDGSTWDALGGFIDTSDLASKSSANTFTAANIFNQNVAFNNPVSYSSNAIMRQGVSTYGLLLPDTSSYTANKEFATSDSFSFKVIPAPASTTLTNDEKQSIIEGCLIKDTFLSYDNAIYFPAREYGGSYYGIVIIGGRESRIGCYSINAINLIQIMNNTDGNTQLNSIARINGKAIPAYPANTGTFVLKCIDGVLTWVSE